MDLCRHCSCGDSEPLNETGESANKNRATRIVFAFGLVTRLKLLLMLPRGCKLAQHNPKGSRSRN